MIFVTLGTQDKPFLRLLKAIEQQIELGNIKEEVIVQSGSTKYNSDKMKIIDYMTIEEFNENLEKADIIITHAGVGTIIQGLENNKIMIVAARKKQYEEHVNNHQEQILENFTKKGYILPLIKFNELNKVLKQAKTFKPNEFKKNNDGFTKNIEEEISRLLK